MSLGNGIERGFSRGLRWLVRLHPADFRSLMAAEMVALLENELRRVRANKGVGATDATVSIFESDGPISSTIVGGIFTQEMVKQTTIALSGLNIILSEGVWINLITDDNTVFVNLGGYYVGAE